MIPSINEYLEQLKKELAGLTVDDASVRLSGASGGSVKVDGCLGNGNDK
ncbi:MAG: hypothetical protein QGI51_05310 [Dehalococcoidales bacterium]|jgi:hypothetical protein|nr:hypothetical protein [Dehalococcoidales bacterium]MDP6825082.1 hypothetical protein [Dehalococcoidales bacterium]MDP7525377.1 hypothetical protein [Dehalococcoidales bacterium]|tara:strand:+ start:468 stop:614 length:147 start_codon:yes stop_codon:yes gene_type:complete